MPPRSTPHHESIPVGPEQGILPAAAERAPEPVVAEALQTITGRDTMDVYGSRLRGTSILGTRAVTMAGIPAIGLGLIQSVIYGPQTFLIGGTTAALAGATVAGFAYAGQRVTEKNRVQTAEEAQTVVRNHLAEPVDVIRDKQKGHPLSVRWYGADQHYSGEGKARILDRFAKVVDFAEAHEVAEVVVSTSLFALGDEASLTEQHKSKLTTTSDLFVEKKGIPIVDRSADETLVQLSPSEARGLLTELSEVAQVSKTDAIAEWLIGIHPEHPFAARYAEWKRLGRPAAERSPLADAMKPGLAQYFANKELTPHLRVKVTDKDGGMSYTRVRVDTSVTVNPRGVTRLSTAQSQGDSEQSASISQDEFSTILGRSVEEHIDQLLERKDEQLNPHERWKLELALYHLLQKPDDTPIATSQARPRLNKAELETDTLYERMLQERPRTSALLPGIGERGTVSKDEQTIEYDRLPFRNAAKKVGAFVLAATIGAATGIGWGIAWGEDEVRDITCEPAPAVEIAVPQTSGPTPEKIAKLCDTDAAKFYDILGTSANKVYDANASYEDFLLIKAYELGILTPNTLDFLKASVSQEWINERAQDILEHYNLYGGAETPVGDVQLGDNRALWSLNPINGAQTTGYWPMNVQSHLFVRELSENGLPPLTDANVSFDRPQWRPTFVPLGTPLTGEQQEDTEFIRVLSIPQSPNDLNKQLIGVSGRLLMANGDSAEFDLDPGNNFQPTFSVPVLEAGDIVAARVVLRGLSDDKIISTQPAIFYQQTDGTFAFTMPRDDHAARGYLDIQYWVDPNSTTDLQVRAEHPMSAQAQGERSQPLTTVLSQHDVAGMRQSLGVTASQDAKSVGDTIALTRSYSFTPYQDSGVTGETTVFTDSQMPLKEVLRLVGEHAANMDEANCNVAGLVEILSTRGTDGDRFLNAINGFSENGDRVLSQVESHAWVVASDGDFIDATPSGGTNPPVEPYKEAPKRGGDDSLGKTGAAFAMVALGGLVIGAGYKFGPSIVAGVRRRRQESATKWFGDDAVDADVLLLGHLLYSKPGAQIDDSDLPASVTQGPPRDGATRLLTIPDMGAKALAAHITERRAKGTLKLSPANERRLLTIISKAQRARGTEG